MHNRKSDFRPVDEKSFEYWIDKAARAATKYRVCGQLFQEAWESSSTEDIEAIIGSFEATPDHEELVRRISMKLFPQQYYVTALEETLFRGQRQDTVLSTRQWIGTTVSRYCRLCTRHEYPMSLSTGRLIETILRSLPEKVERVFRFEATEYNLSTIWKRATCIEEEIRRTGNRIGEQVHQVEQVFPADAEMDPAQKKSKKPVSTDFPTCRSCGAKGHRRRDCPKRQWRCFKCQQVGHISAVCENVAVKDAQDRVRTLVERNPGSTIVSSAHDRALKDKVSIAATVLKNIQS